MEQHDDRGGATGLVPKMPDHPAIAAGCFVPCGLLLDAIQDGLWFFGQLVVHPGQVLRFGSGAVYRQARPDAKSAMPADQQGGIVLA
jgi:hypothetical protein